jgi:uncharacterized protein (DUF305 family)
MKRLIIPLAGLAAGGLLITDSATTGIAVHMSSRSTMPALLSAVAMISAADHNGADVRFSQMMIPHHRQAVEMAGLAGAQAVRPQVKDLAKRIEAAQEPEIQTMGGWLRSWGLEVPGPGAMTMDHGVPGMMSEQAMTKLEGLSGPAFDRAFLEMMIQHHEGAIAMANDERRNGAYEPAKQLAKSIISSQTAEITTMKDLLR